MKNSYYLQLYTGNFEKMSYTSDEILCKLERILDKLPVKCVIMGWCTDYALNMNIVHYLHKKRISCFLWFPVLSEIHDIVETKAAINIDGTTSKPYHANQDEEFSFLCPNSYVNYHSAIELYEQYFKEIPFDGVFLDKIRYASFANGYEEGFGCLCKACSYYLTSHHVDLDKVKTAIVQHDTKLLEGEYDSHGKYHFHDENIDRFYDYRSRLISDYVFKLAAYFNSRKLSVGADLYAPFFAYHCGQNIEEIAGMVDFIKPMIYKNTKAPSGMKFEYNAYLKNFDNKEAFAKHWCDDPCCSESIGKQFSFLKGLPANIIPGIEVTTVQDICDANLESVKDTVINLNEESIHTFVLSWNIMEMKDKIVNILAEL